MKTMYFSDKVTLEPIKHRYFDKEGNEYDSLSRVTSFYQKPFDVERMSKASAKKNLRLSGNEDPSTEELLTAQNDLKTDWNKKRTDAADIGTRIHDAVEHCIKTGQVVIPELDRQIKMLVAYLMQDAYMVFSEQVLFSNYYGIAGTTDCPILRTSRSKVLNIKDFKTNQRKGIQYKSDYGNWLYPPLDHLEDCNYNTYSLQLGGYGLMAEEQGYRIGSLAIIFIDVVKVFLTPAYEDLSFWMKEIPVPYMRTDVRNIFSHFRNHHVLNQRIEVEKQFLAIGTDGKNFMPIEQTPYFNELLQEMQTPETVTKSQQKSLF